MWNESRYWRTIRLKKKIHNELQWKVKINSWRSFYVPGEQWRRQGVARRVLCPVCAPSGKPSSFQSVMQHQFSRFTVPYFAPTEAYFLARIAPEGRILKANFLKFFRVWHPWTPFYARSYPISHSRAGHKHPSAGNQIIVPLGSYGAPLVPQREQTPGAATAR